MDCRSPTPAPHPRRQLARPSPTPGLLPALSVGLLSTLLLGPPGAVATERPEQGDWSAAIPADPAEPCELITGGYDHATDEQDPLLLILIERGRAAPRVHVITPTELTQPELLRARARLRVDGGAAVPLLPAGIVETDQERRVTFRPRFPGAEDDGLRRLVAAMRAGRRVEVDINGLPLEPEFSLSGLDALWQHAAPRCRDN